MENLAGNWSVFGIAGIVVLSGTCFFVWARHRKKRFFQSLEYKSKRETLHEYAEQLEKYLRSPEPIGQAGIQAFLVNSKPCIGFFTGMLSCPENDQTFIREYTLLIGAADRLQNHDNGILDARRATLRSVATRFQSLLSSPNLIGETGILEFVESGREIVEFFAKDPTWLDGDPSRWCFVMYDHAADILRQHDAEIRFEKTVATPLQALLAGPEYITRGQWHGLCEQQRLLAPPMSLCKQWIRPGTEGGVALFKDAENRIVAHNRQIDVEIRFAETFTAPFKALLSGSRYVAHSQWFSLCSRARPLVADLARSTPLRAETMEGLRLLNSAEQRVGTFNRLFVGWELNRCANFFSTLAKYPLDHQQCESCIVDEDAALVIAGAGSGKTSVISAKVAYLIKERGVRPEEIRLITFTKKAAQEMSDRIAACLGERYGAKMEISTFHKFGMNILGLPANNIADEDFLERVTHEVMTGKADFVDNDYSLLVEFAELHFSQEQLERAFASDAGKTHWVGGSKIITLAGERVKSQAERLIANFFFLKGVRYEYEKPYSKPYDRGRARKEYRPDFYLPDHDIYLEHYGVDENGEPPHDWPTIEKTKYKVGMAWKRRLHAEAGNRYVESFSWWNLRGELLERLSEKLKALGVEFRPRPPMEVLKILWKNEENKLGELEKLLATFICLYKSNHYPVDRFDYFISRLDDSVASNKRNKMFLELARQVYRLYEQKLRDAAQCDFNDIINQAADSVRGLPDGTLPYKYLIVDEYQDATVAQMKLLKAVLGNTGAHLFCVGDDWQSIYRFAGSDLSLFTDFKQYFGASAITMRLENTYRNSQELIDIMAPFVTRNPEQIPKKLQSSRHCPHPVRMVWYFEPDGTSDALDRAVAIIAAELEGKAGSVLLLGRNGRDEKSVRKSSLLIPKGRIGAYAAPRHPNIRFQFLTVHKSKGLEADYLVLLNARNDLLGFPTRIEDDPVLQLVQHGHESFAFAEERRLFYVALTRTRNRVFVLAPAKDYSPFVEELLEITGEQPPPPDKGKVDEEVACPKCRCGVLISREGPHGWFTTCSNAPECDWKANVRIGPETRRCPDCGGFLVERHSSKTPDHVFLGCTNYPFCQHKESIAIQADATVFFPTQMGIQQPPPSVFPHK